MKKADICIITEGSYPYYPGGVTRWVSELIRERKECTFHILSLLPPHPELSVLPPFPPNVIGHTSFIVQALPAGAPASQTPPLFWQQAGELLKQLISGSPPLGLEPFLDLFEKCRPILGKRILCESREAWDFFLRFYHEMIPHGPFKAYFATLFTLSRSLFSMTLPKLPEATLYHAVCTGYAGYLLVRAKHEKKAHCILTEHGVYTNERRIEISMADWIADLHSLDLSLEKSTTTLKQFWYKFFYSMAALCYQSCDAILSTFEGTQQIQKNIGADPKKLKTVVHGINPEQYIPLTKLRTAHPFTVAFIGRMVRIKDVMTYIRACHIVSEKRPDVRFLALGPTTEDPDYFKECLQLISMLGMKEVLQFPGEVDPRAYFPQIDLVVLTSISEVQSLVQLEAGSMGIPAVATNVGAAKEIIDGKEGESPSLGPGGIVTPLVSPEATANAILKFVDDRPFYQTCSAAIAQRIGAYYKLEEEQNFYRELYQSYLKGEK